MTRLIAAAVATAFGIGLAVWHSPAWGQDCNAFDDVDAALRGDHQEQAIVLAVDPSGAAFIFYGNPATESWTIVHLAGPCARLLAYGIGYEEIPAIPGEPS